MQGIKGKVYLNETEHELSLYRDRIREKETENKIQGILQKYTPSVFGSGKRYLPSFRT